MTFLWGHMMSHDPEDSLGLTAKEDSDLAISCLGACVHCLTRCLIDRDILSMKSFIVSGCSQWVWLILPPLQKYEPVDMKREGEKMGGAQLAFQRMVSCYEETIMIMSGRGRC